jgi:hypothetical protein
MSDPSVELKKIVTKEKRERERENIEFLLKE